VTIEPVQDGAESDQWESGQYNITEKTKIKL